VTGDNGTSYVSVSILNMSTPWFGSPLSWTVIA
jgi:hypothetical protein